MSHSSRRLPLALLSAVLALLFVAGCSAADPQNTLAGVGEVARKQQDLFWTAFRWAAIVFVLVEALLLFVIFRFRSRPGQPEPHQTHGNTRLEIGWTIAPVLLLLTCAVPTVALLWDLATPPSITMDVKVTGHQWWWEFEYPGMGGVITANELHIPQGEPINFQLTSADVIHSFWVPKLAGKLDVVPGKVQQFWMRGDEAGMFHAQCAELCGIQHANMKFRVVVEPRDQFERWIAAQKAAPRTPDPGTPEARGLEVFRAPASQCIACHTVQGVSVGKVGPNLSHVGGRTTIAAGVLDNTPQNLQKWIHDTQSVKPGVTMPVFGCGAPKAPASCLSDQDIAAVAAYLTTLK